MSIPSSWLNVSVIEKIYKYSFLSRLCLHSQAPIAHQRFNFKFSKDASLISKDYDVLEVKTLTATNNNL